MTSPADQASVSNAPSFTPLLASTHPFATLDRDYLAELTTRFGASRKAEALMDEEDAAEARH